MSTNYLGGGIQNLLERRRSIMGSEKPRQYVDIYKSRFPTNGLVSGRNSFFLYLKETVPIGTKIHLAMTFSSMDNNATHLQIRDTAASPYDISIPMPQNSFDVEFETADRATNIFYMYFNTNVTDVQISSQIVEKII